MMFVGAVVFCFCVLFRASLVSGYCDASVSAEIQKCMFESPLFDLQNSITDETKVIKFCSSTMDQIVDCMERPINECVDSPKEKKLLELLVDMDAIRGGLQYLCDNIRVIQEKATCMLRLGSSDTQQCMMDSLGVITNAGQLSSIKETLDVICRFFEKFLGCLVNPFTGDCKEIGTIYSRVFEGVKYPYCKLSPQEKTVKLNEIKFYSSNMQPGAASTSTWNHFLQIGAVLVALWQIRW